MSLWFLNEDIICLRRNIGARDIFAGTKMHMHKYTKNFKEILDISSIQHNPKKPGGLNNGKRRLKECVQEV
jgi:hypothetical protein